MDPRIIELDETLTGEVSGGSSSSIDPLGRDTNHADDGSHLDPNG